MPTPNLTDKNTAVDFYDKRYEEGYMEEWDDNKKQKVREVISSLNLPAKGKALDFGCGNGVFTNIIKQVLPEWEVYGVEISKIAVANAKRKFTVCHFFSDDEADSYKTQFDFLFSHHVIEHVQDLDETFSLINAYLKPTSSQLHILPCGNEGSFEHHICQLKKNGIEKEQGNRFFFEEPGHLRRLSTKEFESYENKIGFSLKKDFYSNQYDGAVNWITKSSPRFVKKLTNSNDAMDEKAYAELEGLRKKLLPLTYLQFPYSKYWLIKSKWQKSMKDQIFLAALALPALVSKMYFDKYQKLAMIEWEKSKTAKNGSEMYVFFTR